MRTFKLVSALRKSTEKSQSRQWPLWCQTKNVPQQPEGRLSDRSVTASIDIMHKQYSTVYQSTEEKIFNEKFLHSRFHNLDIKLHCIYVVKLKIEHGSTENFSAKLTKKEEIHAHCNVQLMMRSYGKQKSDEEQRRDKEKHRE